MAGVKPATPLRPLEVMGAFFHHAWRSHSAVSILLDVLVLLISEIFRRRPVRHRFSVNGDLQNLQTYADVDSLQKSYEEALVSEKLKNTREVALLKKKLDRKLEKEKEEHAQELERVRQQYEEKLNCSPLSKVVKKQQCVMQGNGLDDAQTELKGGHSHKNTQERYFEELLTKERAVHKNEIEKLNKKIHALEQLRSDYEQELSRQRLELQEQMQNALDFQESKLVDDYEDRLAALQYELECSERRNEVVLKKLNALQTTLIDLPETSPKDERSMSVTTESWVTPEQGACLSPPVPDFISENQFYNFHVLCAKNVFD